MSTNRPGRVTAAAATNGLPSGAIDETAVDPVRRALLDAGCHGPPPDPLAALTFRDAASYTGIPASTIASRFPATEDQSSIAVYRGEVFRNIIARFDRRPSEAIHTQLTTILLEADNLAEIMAELGRCLADHFAAQPQVPWVLGGASRGHIPGVADDLRSLWRDFGSDVASLIEIILAARHVELDIERPVVVASINVSVVTGWLNTRLSDPPRPLVSLDGALFEPTGLVLWSCLRRRLTGPGAPHGHGVSR